MEEPRRSDQFVVRLPREEIDRASELAREKGYSLSEAVRLVMRRFIKGSIRLPTKPSAHSVSGEVERAPVSA